MKETAASYEPSFGWIRHGRKKGISCRFLDVRLFEKLVRNMMCLIVNGLKMSDKSNKSIATRCFRPAIKNKTNAVSSFFWRMPTLFSD